MTPDSKITSSHLSRLAIVYLRQSSMAQVRQNTESTARQYGLATTAAELGWLAEQIVVVDADLGVSGRCRKDSKVTYKCAEPTTRCRTVTADTVDDAVAALLLQTMTPQQIAVALAAADEVADRQVRTHRAAELAAERARYETDRAERAFSQVEPENRLVARTLESRWEAKLATLAEAEAALATARAIKPALPDHNALLALTADLPHLWAAETTSPRDRKRLLRTLVADVTLLPEPDAEAVRVGVRWHTGASDELTVQRRGPGRTPPEVLAIVREYGATHSNVQIATMLNDAGLRTGKNLRFTPRHVAGVRGIYKIFTPRTVAVHDGEINVKQAAERLGIPADAIYNWLRHEQIPARLRAGRWCIPWDGETQEIYRQKVARSFRLKSNPAAMDDDLARTDTVTVNTLTRDP